MRVINLAGLLFVLLLGCSENEPLMTQPEPEPEPELNALYKLTFNASWSAQTHPNDFPSSAHFSGLIGMTHNGNTMLFAKGEIASDGIKNMAETGGKNPLEAEIQNLITIGTAETLISGGFFLFIFKLLVLRIFYIFTLFLFFLFSFSSFLF